MNALLSFETLLRYWKHYHARMGEFRPVIDMKFKSVVTQKEESLYEIVQGNEALTDIVIYMDGKESIFFQVANSDLSVEEFSALYQPQVDLLRPLAQHVASLYGFGQTCLCCGEHFCTEKYCKEKCKSAIPCDRCGRKRFAKDYLNLSNQNDTLHCRYCEENSNGPVAAFSFDTLVQFIYRIMPKHMKTMQICGDISACNECEILFMHSDDVFVDKCYKCMPQHD